MANSLDRIIFSDHFLIDIPVIDKQHEVLINIYNHLVENLKDGSNLIGAADIQDRLIDYTCYHFSNEEQMQEACQYPGLVAHRKQHEVFISALKKLATSGDSTGASMVKLAGFLGQWITHHILVTDKEMGKVLNQNKNPPEEMGTFAEKINRYVNQDSAGDRLHNVMKNVQIHGLWLKGKSTRQAELEFADLSGLTLDGVELQAASLVGVNLAKSSLRGANLANAILTGADLEEADLSDANLTGADLRGANLHRARLTAASLRGADLCAKVATDMSVAGTTQTILAEANLERAILCHAKLVGCDFSGADLSEADLDGADLSDSVMIGADLHGAQLNGVVMTGTVIDLSMLDAGSVKAIGAAGGGVSVPEYQAMDAMEVLKAIDDHERWIDSGGHDGKRLDLDRVSFPALTTNGRNLAGCRLRRCRIEGGVWTAVDLSMADLSYTNMNGINLENAKLQGTTLRRASLIGANLTSVVFDALPLARGGRVWPANLEGANLTGANLSGVSLDGAILRKADLTGCIVVGISVRNADFTGARR